MRQQVQMTVTVPSVASRFHIFWFRTLSDLFQAFFNWHDYFLLGRYLKIECQISVER
ncbi:hypothetical protein Fmac_032579 [Flemingia macrophylla]|uniref:Uncharacterized protein n=1 Tax=Flemingia macrophylla TaxID=520843 RepID=A0ABD1L5B5_9FABA